MADPLNSSDQEFPSDEEDRQPFKHLGAKYIEKMRENAIEHRMQSKVGLKKLNKNNLSSRTEAGNRARTIWANRFEAFYAEALGKTPDQAPGPDDVLRFFLQLPSVLGPSKLHSRTAYGYSAFRDGAALLLDHVFYRHASARSAFRDSNFDLRLRSLLNTHVEDGFLTRDSAREGQWISSQLLARMCRALLLDAVDHGTRCWDWVLQDVLLLAMLCGTVSRIGDLLRSYDKGNQFVAWKDITLKLVTEVSSSGGDDAGGGGVPQEVLAADVKLRYTKGAKDVPSSFHSHRFRPLHPQYASACVIRLLLTHALRVGAVHGAPGSFEEVLAAMRRSPGKTLRWRIPDDPVFLRDEGKKDKSHGLIPGAPASSRIRKKALEKAAELIGLPVPDLRAHDTRRGGAKDVARLPRELLPGMNSEAARRVLGHTTGAARRGVTDRYTGGDVQDHYATRIHNADILTAGDDFALDTTLRGAPYVRPKKLDPALITRTCEEKGWSPHDQIQRNKAGLLLRRTHKARWVSGKDDDDDNHAGKDAGGTGFQQHDEGEEGEEEEQPAPKKPRLVMVSPPPRPSYPSIATPSPATIATTRQQPHQGEAGPRPVTLPAAAAAPLPTRSAQELPRVQVAEARGGGGVGGGRRRSLRRAAAVYEYPPPPGEEDDEDEEYHEQDYDADCQEGMFDQYDEAHVVEEEEEEEEEGVTADAMEAFIASSAELAQAAGLVGMPYELLGGEDGPDPLPTTTTTTTTPDTDPRARDSNEEVSSPPPLFVTSGDTAADNALRSHVCSSSTGAFVSCLSRVNSVAHVDTKSPGAALPSLGAATRAAYQSLLGYPTSKDLPKQVRYLCPNSARGCTYTSRRPGDIRKHAQFHCPLSAGPEPPTLACPEEGCNAKLKGEKSLQQHIKREHVDKNGKFRDYSVMCLVPGCDRGPYKTPAAAKQHLVRAHGFSWEEAASTEAEWSALSSSSTSAGTTTTTTTTTASAATPPEDEEAPGRGGDGGPDSSNVGGLVTGFPKPCPLAPADCDSTYVYKDRQSLVSHFIKKHRVGWNKGPPPMTRDFDDVPHPPVVYQAKEFKHLMNYTVLCQVPGCKRGSKLFPTPNALQQHLKGVHKMPWAKAKELEGEWRRSNQADKSTTPGTTPA